MDITSYGFIGAAVGFVWALVDYLVLMPLILRPLRAGLAELTGADRDKLARRISLLQVLFAVQFVVFPVIGYFIGRTLSG
jgi:hypothetical protein